MLFFSEDLKWNNSVTTDITERRVYRGYVFQGALRFTTGDVLLFVFWAKNILYRFEGICIVIRKKSLKHNNCILIIRNIMVRIAIEIIIAYYLNRIFFLSISDYKRKVNFYGRSKLYYVRDKLNQSSRVFKKTALMQVILKK